MKRLRIGPPVVAFEFSYSICRWSVAAGPLDRRTLRENADAS